MKNIIIISDSFKGTISSKEISELFENEFKKHFHNANLSKYIVADGGEGTIDAIHLKIKSNYVYMNVKNPLFKEINARYLISGDTQYIELAQAAGITLIDNLNPMITTTYGVGEMMKDAINRFHVKKIFIGLGGSATNDGACGASQALGTKFYNKDLIMFTPTGGSLKDIYRIDNTETNKLLKGVEVILLSDCLNPMYGKSGASFVYAKQKGATTDMINELDLGLKHLSNIFKKTFGKDVSKIKGGGAAGAFGAGAIALFNAKIVSGIDTILDIVNFKDDIINADYIFTGEGRFDNESLNGKVISGIIKYRDTYNKNAKIVVVAGSIDKTNKKVTKNKSIYKMYSTTDKELSIDELKIKAKENYIKTINKCFDELKNEIE